MALALERVGLFLAEGFDCWGAELASVAACCRSPVLRMMLAAVRERANASTTYALLRLQSSLNVEIPEATSRLMIYRRRHIQDLLEFGISPNLEFKLRVVRNVRDLLLSMVGACMSIRMNSRVSSSRSDY